jgi:hypothetical protein
MRFRTIVLPALAVTALLASLGFCTAGAQTQRDEQFYYPGGFNWEFLATYPEAARLFNAFDYGHAVLYERLYTKRGEAGPELEKEYRYLTTDLLVRPPRFAVAEEVVMPAYAKLAWRAKMMFDWAHVLHRQIYDAYADDRLNPAQRDTLIEQLTEYYLSNRKYAFTDRPKSMALMDEQYFSQTFRKTYPKFNGLIWAYHWLQVGLYEPFIEESTKAERKAGVQATVARFWSMLEDPPNRFPKYMPMTSAIAPKFSAAHPRAAVIFDNLHMMHDIISDVLTADTIPHQGKGEMIDQQLDKLQDPTRDVLSMDEWRMMADHMGGVDAMGGPATGLLGGVHAPVTPSPDSAPMAGAMRHEAGEMSDTGRAAKAGMAQHEGHEMPGMQHPRRASTPSADSIHQKQMMDLHRRMMADPVIRQRVMGDSAMRRLMNEMMGHGKMRQRQQREKAAPKPETQPRKRKAPTTPPPADSLHQHQGHSMGTAPANAPRAGGTS